MMRNYNCLITPRNPGSSIFLLRSTFMLMLMFMGTLTFAAKNFVGGGGDLLFSNPSNWQGGNMPTIGDDIDIESDCIYDLLTIQTYGAIKIRNGATLSYATGSETLSCEVLLDAPSDGTLDMSAGGTLQIIDRWQARPGKLTFVPGSGTVSFMNSSSTSSFPDDYLIFNNIVVSSDQQTVQLENDVHLTGDLTIVSGILDSDGYNISLNGDWTNIGGSFLENQALVQFTGCGQNFNSSDSVNLFYDLTIQSCACVTFNASVNVLGTFTVSGPSVCDSVWANNTDLLIQDWHTKGNIIEDSEEFLGTVNDADLRVKTNNQDRMIIKNTGEIGIGTTSPTSTLDVNGEMRVRGISNDNSLTEILVKDADGNVFFRDASTIEDADSDPTNEIETWSTLAGIPADILDGDQVDDADNDPTNEIETWSTLAGIPADILDGDQVDDADNDPTNEIETWSTLAGIPADILDGDQVDDADNDPTNEIETWSTLAGIPGDILDGDQVDDADNDPTNEFNSGAALVGTDLNITDGGGTLTVDLSALSDNDWIDSGANQYSGVTGNVGIGTSTPSAKLEVTEDILVNDISIGKGSGDIAENTVVGKAALAANTSGERNTSVGYKTLENNTTGESNTAVGSFALNKITDWSNNVAVGSSALYNNLAPNNTAIGMRSMYDNTDGTNNTAVGAQSLTNNTTGNNNTTSGYLSMQFNTTGRDNTASGYLAMTGNTTGRENTALGSEAMYSNTIGSHNTSVGYHSGYNSNGDRNVFIGHKSGFNEAGSDKLYIENSDNSDPLIWGDFATDEVKIHGTLGISDQYVFPSADGANGQVIVTDGSGGLSWQTPIDNDPTNEIETWSTLAGIPADLLDGDQVDDADNDPTNEYNTGAALTGTDLNITDGGGTLSVDLSGLVTNDADWSVSGVNQYSAVSGNVGIGTTNPTSKLEVAGGDAKINNITFGKGGGSVINNTAVGQYALSSNTVGHVNSAFGSSSLLNNTTGTSNTGIGFRTLESNTTGSFNSAVGIQSQLSGVTGKFNNSMGVNSMLLNETGQANLAIGYGALYSGTAIYNNVALGHQAGWNTQGSGNIFLGSQAGYDETGSNKLYIDNTSTSSPLIWGDFATNEIKIHGTLGISDQYVFPSADGANGQVMVTDGSGGLSWQTSLDNDPTNEIETWSTLAGIPADLLDGDQVDDADNDPTNEYNTTLELVGQELRLTDGGGTLSVMLNSGADSDWTVDGSDMYSQVTGNVGVGTNTPQSKLDVNGDALINGLTLGRGGAQFLSNSVFGYMALQNNTSGSDNTALGFRTLENNSTGSHNVAIGRQALIGSTTGSSNISIGSESMFSNQNGSNNIAIGFGSMTSNTSGRQNSALGDRTLFLNSSGFENVAMGGQALYSNGLGRENTAIGYRAMYENEGGSRGTAVGHSAMRYISDASAITTNYNVAVGYEALRGSTTASNNTGNTNSAFGYQAMRVNTTGGNNVAIGSYSMYNNSTGSINTAVGERSLMNNTSGSRNSAISAEVLRQNTTGSYNSGGGSHALYNNQTGDYNTAFGYYAGDGHDGSNNTYLGALSDATTGGLTNATAIGYMATVDANNKVRLGNASVTSNGGQVGWTSYSDERIKKDVDENVPGLEFISKLRPVTYHYDVDKQNEILGISKEDMNEVDYEIEKIEFTGFMAQEVASSANEIGYDFSGVDKTGELLGLRYSSFVVPLVKGMQEQQEEIEEMETVIKEQDEKISDLETRIKILEEKFDLILSGSVQHEDLKFEGPWIEQNYPNPFEGQTTIKYYVPQDAHSASVIFYNVNGLIVREVKIEIFGKGQLQLDGRGLSSGLYSYELKVNDEIISSKKMIHQRD